MTFCSDKSPTGIGSSWFKGIMRTVGFSTSFSDEAVYEADLGNCDLVTETENHIISLNYFKAAV